MDRHGAIADAPKNEGTAVEALASEDHTFYRSLFSKLGLYAVTIFLSCQSWPRRVCM
jgi:hypothetical protein